jgi:hypothetical protein
MLQVIFKHYKCDIRAFLQTYPADRLADLLAHAQDGKLSYRSCCCLIGVATADHPLRGRIEHIPHFAGIAGIAQHYASAIKLPGAVNADYAYCHIAERHNGQTGIEQDALRRRILIPMVLAEFRRRDRLKDGTLVPAEQAVIA